MWIRLLVLHVPQSFHIVVPHTSEFPHISTSFYKLVKIINLGTNVFLLISDTIVMYVCIVFNGYNNVSDFFFPIEGQEIEDRNLDWAIVRWISGTKETITTQRSYEAKKNPEMLLNISEHEPWNSTQIFKEKKKREREKKTPPKTICVLRACSLFITAYSLMNIY